MTNGEENKPINETKVEDNLDSETNSNFEGDQENIPHESSSPEELNEFEGNNKESSFTEELKKKDEESSLPEVSKEENASLHEENASFPEDNASFPEVDVDGIDDESKSESEVEVFEEEPDLIKTVNSKRYEHLFSFQDVSIKVHGRRGCGALSNLGPVNNYLKEQLGHGIECKKEFTAINNVSGYIKSGETVLLLGPTGSGRTTLLRALSARLNKKDTVEGTFCLDGEEEKKLNHQKWRRFTSFVSAQDDSHSPNLTVYETLLFAASLCNEKKITSDENIKIRVSEMLKRLDLTHVAKTVVGDENLRGVSGGQKRRVTIGEMLLNEQTPFLFLDDISQGLDSVTTISLMQGIQKGCRELGFGALVALKGASDEIIQSADKLLILDNDGGLAYFGTSQLNVLSAHFPNLNYAAAQHKSILESILENLSNDNYQPECFKQSGLYTNLIQELEASKSSSSKPKLMKQKSAVENIIEKKYATCIWNQIKILSWRHFLLTKRNAMTYARIFIAILFGIIVGTLFTVAGKDLIGSIAVIGYLFLSLFLTLMLSAAVAIPENFRQRPSIFKHRSAEFYNPYARYLVQVIGDLPLSILESVIISAIPFSLITGLNTSGSAYAYFLGILIGLECVGQALGRLMSALMPTQIMATTFCTASIFLAGSLAGFLPPYESIGWWFRWISWINPAAYAYEGVMLNNFAGQTIHLLSLTGEYEVNIGSIDGSFINGFENIPRPDWPSSLSDSNVMAIDLAMLFVFAFVLDIIGMFAGERCRIKISNLTRRPIFATKSKINKTVFVNKSKDDLKTIEDAVPQGEQDVDEIAQVFAHGHTNLWKPERLQIKKLSYFVKDKGGREIQLLKKVNGVFHSGSMTALMGSSGAGKSTLMDCIAGIKTGGRITGKIMIDDIPKISKEWRRISAYAEQMDVFNPFLSIEETLLVTSYCQHKMSKFEHHEFVMQCLKMVDLEDLANYCVGKEREGGGLAKHARKRLTIANALAQKPKILFCDEPTSGLGIMEAIKVMDSIQTATKKLDLITLVTIHQPGNLFYKFDDIMVLAKGGQVAYTGPIGEVKGYFSKNCPESITIPDDNSNDDPSDFILSVVEELKDAPSLWKRAVYAKSNSLKLLSLPTTTSMPRDDNDESDDESNDGSDNNDKSGDECLDATNINNNKVDDNLTIQPEEAATVVSPSTKKDLKNERVVAPYPSTLSRFSTLIWRQFLVEWRNPRLSLVRFQISIASSIYIGILFLNLDQSLMSAVNSIACLFYAVLMLVVPMQVAAIPLIEDRAVYFREIAAGSYTRLSYAFSHLIANLPFHFVNGIVFLIIYYIAGLRQDSSGYVGYFILIMVMSNWFIPTLGQMFAYLCPNEETANGLAGISAILSVILCGFLLASSAFPNGWYWAYQIDSFRFILQGLVTNQLENQYYELPSAIMNIIPFNPEVLVEYLVNITDSMAGDHHDNRLLFESSNFAVPEYSSFTNFESTRRNLDIKLPANIDQIIQELLNDIQPLVILGSCAIQQKCIDITHPKSIFTNITAEITCMQNFCSTQLMGLTKDVVAKLFKTFQCMLSDQDDDTNRRLLVAKRNLENNLDHIVSISPDDKVQIIEKKIIPDVIAIFGKIHWKSFIGCFATAFLGENLWTTIKDFLVKVGFDIRLLLHVILDILQKGVPGELILLYFGWAKIGDMPTAANPHNFKLSYDTNKWYYCVFALAFFILGIEILKLLFIRFVCWTKR